MGHGWDQAVFTCGRCGEPITATTQEQYLLRVGAHETVHDLLDAATPELRAKIINLALAQVEAAT